MSKKLSNYEKLIGILKKSEPVLHDASDVEVRVMQRIGRNKEGSEIIRNIIDSFFGWIYISWIRQTLAGIAAVVFIIFLYQQAVILKDIRKIEKEVISISARALPDDTPDLKSKLTVLRLFSKMGSENLIETEDIRFKELLDSYDNLQLKYKNLTRIIEEDSVLKEMVEKKLMEESGKKIKM